MTSKQRAYLKGLAMKMEPIMQLGKGSVTPENTAAVEKAGIQEGDTVRMYGFDFDYYK